MKFFWRKWDREEFLARAAMFVAISGITQELQGIRVELKRANDLQERSNALQERSKNLTTEWMRTIGVDIPPDPTELPVEDLQSCASHLGATEEV